MVKYNNGQILINFLRLLYHFLDIKHYRDTTKSVLVSAELSKKGTDM